MKHFFRGATFAFMLIASSAICLQLTQAKGESAQSSKIKDSETIQTVQIELNQPVTVDALFSTENVTSFEGAILESEFSLKNEAIHDFYTVNSGNKGKNIKADYIKNRKAFLMDTKKSMKASDFNTKNVEDLLITKITVNGKKSNIDNLKKGLTGKVNIESDQPVFIPTGSAKTSPFIAGGTSTAVMAASTSLAYLAPNSGTSYFYPSSSGGRYVQQNMKWNAIYFSWDQTYEHDVFLYNYDNQTYLNSSSSAFPGCYPVTLYAATSWPSAAKPYIDTRLSENLVSCEKDELAFTIGVAQASALQANVDYYTYMRTTSGNASSDKFKLQGQIGHRNPTNCYTTWCSWGNESINLVPAWSSLVPGTKSWVR